MEGRIMEICLTSGQGIPFWDAGFRDFFESVCRKWGKKVMGIGNCTPFWEAGKHDLSIVFILTGLSTNLDSGSHFKKSRETGFGEGVFPGLIISRHMWTGLYSIRRPMKALLVQLNNSVPSPSVADPGIVKGWGPGYFKAIKGGLNRLQC